MSVLLALLAWAFLLFWFYLAYVALIQAKRNGKLAKAPLLVKLVVWATLGIAVVLDVAFNLVVGSAAFLELPELRRLTFTMRCKKHLMSQSWRGRLARWVCDGWLNPFEEGHC